MAFKYDIKLVAIDLDGTLLTSDKKIAPNGARMIKSLSKSGVKVVLATTRNPEETREYCRQLGLQTPMICSSGAQVWGSPDGPAWSKYTIPISAALSIACMADAHGWELTTTVGQTTYMRQRPGQALGYISTNKKVVPGNVDGIVGSPVRILTWTPSSFHQLRQLCENELSEYCYAETFFKPNGEVESLGIFARSADKGSALQLVMDKLNLKRIEVMAIGDNFVDVPMFKCAGVGVALANAHKGVKREADYVGPSNDHEGVAWALEKFFKGCLL